MELSCRSDCEFHLIHITNAVARKSSEPLFEYRLYFSYWLKMKSILLFLLMGCSCLYAQSVEYLDDQLGGLRINSYLIAVCSTMEL